MMTKMIGDRDRDRKGRIGKREKLREKMREKTRERQGEGGRGSPRVSG